MPVLRLDRILSGQGIGTRKEIKGMLSKGFITVNGKIVSYPAMKIDTGKDTVCVQGTPVDYREHVYIMMNKPSGVISAANDPKKQTVIDLLPQELRRPGLFPAGRLDRDTEGFMLITDDGTFAHNILSPKKHVEKEYAAIIDGPLSPEQIQSFESGLVIDGDIKCLPASIRASEAGTGGDGVRVTVIIHEGKYHQVKRMFEALGRRVLYLKRTSIGGLRIDPSLDPGEARELTEAEVELISSSDREQASVTQYN